MTDREKIMNDFEHEVNKAHGEGWDFVDLSTYDAKKILVLLKEQEPLVIHKCGFTAQCPECRMTWMMWQPDNMRYCPGCGRPVKWDD